MTHTKGAKLDLPESIDEAYAKLIAAAPDLLEALIDITNIAIRENWLGHSSYIDGSIEAVKKAKAAIQKAIK